VGIGVGVMGVGVGVMGVGVGVMGVGVGEIGVSVGIGVTVVGMGVTVVGIGVTVVGIGVTGCGAMLKLTETNWGLLVTPFAVTISMAEFEPADMLAKFAVNCTCPPLLPEAGLTVNQVGAPLIVQLKLPPPPLLIIKVLAAGFEPPRIPSKVKLVGLSCNKGSADLVSVTLTNCTCPLAVTAIWPE